VAWRPERDNCGTVRYADHANSVDLDDKDKSGVIVARIETSVTPWAWRPVFYLYSAVSLTERGYAKAIEPRLHNYRADPSGPRRIIAMDYFEEPQGLHHIIEMSNHWVTVGSDLARMLTRSAVFGDEPLGVYLSYGQS
jgi:hypothetical protein